MAYIKTKQIFLMNIYIRLIRLTLNYGVLRYTYSKDSKEQYYSEVTIFNLSILWARDIKGLHVDI